MTLRLTDEENDHLAELAAAEGRSKQEIMRLALAERWARLRKEEDIKRRKARNRAAAKRSSYLHWSRRPEATQSRFWTRWTGFVMRRPWLSYV